jgi:hypothetical protein
VTPFRRRVRSAPLLLAASLIVLSAACGGSGEKELTNAELAQQLSRAIGIEAPISCFAEEGYAGTAGMAYNRRCRVATTDAPGFFVMVEGDSACLVFPDFRGVPKCG